MVEPAIAYFDPPVAAAPARLASPFDPGEPHPLARAAAGALIGELRGWPGLGLDDLDAPGGGKMFGVLIVAGPDGRIGTLRGFSGMLDGAWCVPGFVPPLFDPAARDAFWPAGERELGELDRALRALADDPDAAVLRAGHAALAARHAAELAALRARHRDHRGARHAARQAIRAAGADPAALHAHDQASRGDAAERRRLLAAHAAERAAIATRLDALDATRAALARHRAERSRALMTRIHDSYVLSSARGERRPLRALFAPGEPPSGAGDCAGPKLLGHAYRLGATPLALAEFWWGAPPATGGRRAGQFYPSCRGKCGPLLAFMLDGLACAAAPVFGAAATAADEPRVVHEDRWLVVVDKPCGLLSVPGRDGRLQDSVLTRLRARWPGATTVHRLDLDASGLLVAAKDPATHAALQRAFACREVDKRYVAWLDGPVAGDRGTVALALRVDLDDRPRQLVDPEHGKPAITDWQVVERAGARTRVHLVPRTGRSHQLRVHAAHPLGLGAPIAGDRLYGRAAERLALHAEALAFVHPHTGRWLRLERLAPF
ncbi:MAG TPA: RluA family pseudouridine synthase [Kofleriaceae bacterium]|nr:RluA family pseudouridine synthase [Kofleriaceae bacterium]